MQNFADRIIEAIHRKGNPCIIGLDPRIDMMPGFISSNSHNKKSNDFMRSALSDFHRIIIDVIAPLVPAVKLQIAFYEQYGLSGLAAFVDTIRLAKEKDLIVIVDAKRNDIASTAKAYANAFLGCSNIIGSDRKIFDVDCITVSPFLGKDSLQPFVETCGEYGKGIFVLVKTSNPGSVDIQDQCLSSTGSPLYEKLAKMVDEIGSDMIGKFGYSSIGAVVGATFPEEALQLRELMPKAIILVPGYGSQGGSAKDSVRCFNQDGLGAVVNASRSITYELKSKDIGLDEFTEMVQERALNMIQDINMALEDWRSP